MTLYASASEARLAAQRSSHSLHSTVQSRNFHTHNVGSCPSVLCASTIHRNQIYFCDRIYQLFTASTRIQMSSEPFGDAKNEMCSPLRDCIDIHLPPATNRGLTQSHCVREDSPSDSTFSDQAAGCIPVAFGRWHLLQPEAAGIVSGGPAHCCMLVLHTLLSSVSLLSVEFLLLFCCYTPPQPQSKSACLSSSLIFHFPSLTF